MNIQDLAGLSDDDDDDDQAPAAAAASAAAVDPDAWLDETPPPPEEDEEEAEADAQADAETDLQYDVSAEPEPEPEPSPPQTPASSRRGSKRSRASDEDDDNPRTPKRARMASEASEMLADFYAGRDSVGGAGAGGDNKNNGRKPAAVRRPLIDPDTGLPNWAEVDAMEPVQSDVPDWNPFLYAGVAGDKSKNNVFMDDWEKAAAPEFMKKDLLAWTTHMQALYNQDLWMAFDPGPRDDEGLPLSTEPTQPFYRSAIFKYFHDHLKAPWCVLGVRAVKLRTLVELASKTLFQRDLADPSIVIQMNDKNAGALQKLHKMLQETEAALARVKV
jgi:hypothetical protein